MYRLVKGFSRTRVSIPVLLALLLLGVYLAGNFTHCAQCGRLTWKNGDRVYEDYDHDGALVWYCPKCNHIGKAKFGGEDDFRTLYPYKWMFQQ